MSPAKDKQGLCLIICRKRISWAVLVLLAFLGVLYVAVPTAVWMLRHPHLIGDTSFYHFVYFMSYLPSGFGMYFMGLKYALDYALLPGYVLYGAFIYFACRYYQRKRFAAIIVAWVALLLLNMGGCAMGEHELTDAFVPGDPVNNGQ